MNRKFKHIEVELRLQKWKLDKLKNKETLQLKMK